MKIFSPTKWLVALLIVIATHIFATNIFYNKNKVQIERSVGAQIAVIGGSFISAELKDKDTGTEDSREQKSKDPKKETIEKPEPDPEPKKVEQPKPEPIKEVPKPLPQKVVKETPVKETKAKQLDENAVKKQEPDQKKKEVEKVEKVTPKPKKKIEPKPKKEVKPKPKKKIKKRKKKVVKRKTKRPPQKQLSAKQRRSAKRPVARQKGGGNRVQRRNTSGNAITSNYKGRLVSHLRRYKHYPLNAREQKITGSPRVSFTINASGRVVRARIAKSSGSSILDKAALTSVRKASPFPAIPKGGPKTLSITVPLIYRVN